MSTYKFETRALHSGQEQPDPATGARTVPIYQTTSYVFENCLQAENRFNLSEGGYIYSRLGNPTQQAFEERIASLEGGIGALALASGSAAITATILTIARSGDHIVASNAIYGGTFNLLAHTLDDVGITTTFVDVQDLAAVDAAIGENTKALFIESIGNPNADLCDIEALAALAHRHAIPLIVDNTFATPYLLRPIEWGADIVVHSATKFIGGHGTSIGGVIVDGGSFDWEASGKFPTLSEPNPSYHGTSFTALAQGAAFIAKARAVTLRDTGASLSPFHSFLFIQGLETLALRVERHTTNALKVVSYLAGHPRVRRVNHPSVKSHPNHDLYTRYFSGGGVSIFTFDVAGSKEETTRFIDSLKLFSLLANVADMKSLVIHPSTTTHSQLSASQKEEQHIYDSTVRLSIGCEHPDDLIADLEQAFSALEG